MQTHIQVNSKQKYTLFLSLMVAIAGFSLIMTVQPYLFHYSQEEVRLLEIHRSVNERIAFTWALPSEYPELVVYPADAIPNLTQLQNEIGENLENTIRWFNDRYNTKLSATYSFDAPNYNQTKSYYNGNGEIHFANRSLWQHPTPNAWYVCTGRCSEHLASHEFCHLVLDQHCSIDWRDNWKWGESFCQVFSNSPNEHCSNESMHYCLPYKTSDVNRLQFLDCMFKECSGGYKTVKQVNECYLQAKLAKEEQ